MTITECKDEAGHPTPAKPAQRQVQGGARKAISKSATVPASGPARENVQDILEYLAGGMTEDEILEDFSELTHADIKACLAFAADRERKLFVASG